MPLTKADLVEGVSASAQLSKKESEAIVNVFLRSLVDALRSGDGIELRGFGSFRFRQQWNYSSGGAGGVEEAHQRTGSSAVPPSVQSSPRVPTAGLNLHHR